MLRKSLRIGQRRSMHNMVVADHVKQALSSGAPVIALESTIISHGMPYPRNVEVAKLVEDTVRAAGCVPATIAIIKGVPKIGISAEEIHMLALPRTATDNADMIWKASRRDLGYICAMKHSASTTVASTMILAHAASIPIFATGGIGGAHYDAQHTMDISADLMELGKTPVAVVSAGIKSILDLKLTMEVLETQGVPVIGYKCKEMPSFFTNSSGIQLPMNVQTPMEAAQVLQCTWGPIPTVSSASRMTNGMLFTVPNPKPLVLAGGRSVEDVVQEAVLEAKNQGVKGAKITPFLLQRIEQLTAGQSLESNIALIVNNARTAAEIACAYAELRNSGGVQASVLTSTSNLSHKKTPTVSVVSDSHAWRMGGGASVADIVVIGGAVVDYVAYPKKSPAAASSSDSSDRFIPGSSNPGTMKISYGGVGRNIAEAIGRLGGCNVMLLSSVGGDISGQGLLAHAKEQCNIDVSQVAVVGVGETDGASDGSVDSAAAAGTASYTAIHNGTTGDLIVGIADMDIFQQCISPAYITRALAPALFPPVSVSDSSAAAAAKSQPQKHLSSLLLATDGNVSVAAFKAITKLADMASHRSLNPVDVTVFFDGTSDVKCTLPLLATSMHHVDILKPNVGELVELATMLVNLNMVSVNAKTVGSTLVALRARRNISGEVKEGYVQPDSGSYWNISEVRCLAVAVYHAMTFVPSPAILSLRNNQSGSNVDDAVVDKEIHDALEACAPKCYMPNDSAAAAAAAAAGAATIRKKTKHVLVTLGSQGVLWISNSAYIHKEQVKLSKDINAGTVSAAVAKSIKIIDVNDDVSAAHIPSCGIEQRDIVNTSGAGDTFCGTLLHAISTGGNKSASSVLTSLSENVTFAGLLYALQGAKASLQSKTAIPVDLRQRLRPVAAPVNV